MCSPWFHLIDQYTFVMPAAHSVLHILNKAVTTHDDTEWLVTLTDCMSESGHGNAAAFLWKTVDLHMIYFPPSTDGSVKCDTLSDGAREERFQISSNVFNILISCKWFYSIQLSVTVKLEETLLTKTLWMETCKIYSERLKIYWFSIWCFYLWRHLLYKLNS